MADRFLQIMVQLAERNSYQSLRAFRELALLLYSSFKSPGGIMLIQPSR